jgi:phosphatidylglycerophosphatase C
MSNPKQETVVFDFDGTLVADDTGLCFYRWLLADSRWRRALLYSSTPAIAPLLIPEASRLFGVNVACYLSSAFQGQSLFALREAFIRDHFGGGAVVYAEGLEELRHQQRVGRKVLIISGSPRWLLHGVLKYLGLRDCTLIASECEITGGGLLLREHCFSAHKVVMARRRGFDPGAWVVGYTDSAADIPMLEHCRTRVLINASSRREQHFRGRFGDTLQTRKWG